MARMPEDKPPAREAPHEAVVLPFRTPLSLAPSVNPEQILESLFATWSGQLTVIASDLVPDPDDAHDLVSQAYIELWNRFISLGRVPKAGYEAFLFGAVRLRAMKNRHRRWHRKRLLEAYNYAAGIVGAVRHWMLPSHRFDAADLERIVKEALADMTPRCRELQIMHRHAGMSVAEIAAALEISPETSASMLQRGNRVLRQHLVKAGYSPEGRRASAQMKEIR
jgi:RNA polymerase sigma-70 factor, ECF subfamily